jgi:methyltransferase (TIGR00027 family)
MAKQTVSRTALGAAICRMIEQYQPAPTRLFNDAVVKDLVGAPVRVMMQAAFMRSLTVKQTDAVGAGIFGAQICRTRYIDDAVQAALRQGIGQLVILGAGLDTRPYRLPGMDRVKVFEVDLPAVQSDKKEKIQKHFGRLPENVTFIPIDFDKQNLDSVFAGTGFDPAKPAVFIWEGVTQYITAAAVSRTLAFVGKSAPGSVIVFTYVLKSVIERRSDIPGADHMLDVVSQSSPWIFGLEPTGISAFLEPFQLSLVADVGAADYQARYLKPLGRALDVSPVERIAHARVA